MAKMDTLKLRMEVDSSAVMEALEAVDKKLDEVGAKAAKMGIHINITTEEEAEPEEEPQWGRTIEL